MKYRPIRIPPSVMTVCGYSFDHEAALNWGKVVALITVHFRSPIMNVYGLAYLAWKQVVFLANYFYTGTVDGFRCIRYICILYNGFTSVLLFTGESRRTFYGEWKRNFNFFIISDSLVGGIVCHYCNSKEGECSTNSLYGTREYSCGGDYHHCALYRKVLPNGTTAQVVRSCERDCNRPVIRWTVGKYQKTSHCKLCCDSDFCNDQLTDPCSNSTRLTSKEFLVILLVILGLCAWYSDIHLKGAQQVYIWHKTINF